MHEYINKFLYFFTVEAARVACIVIVIVWLVIVGGV